MNNYDITIYLLDQGINYNEPNNNSYGSMSITPLDYSKDETISELLRKIRSEHHCWPLIK